jgi:hypothetical protein
MERLLGLQNDTYAGCEAGNWIFGEVYTINMLVSPLPHPTGRPQHLYCGPGAEGVSRESKNKKLAFEFAKYINDTNQQIDGYYGHGYTVGRLSSWKRLDEDDKEDQEIRRLFLEPFTEGHGSYICQPQINRTSHDGMDVVVFVALGENVAIVKAHSWQAKEAEEEAQPESGTAAVDVEAIAKNYAATAKELADKVAKMSGERVTVIVQGTPKELAALRSNIRKSPIPAYLPLLEGGVFQPNMKIWDRIMGEVVAFAIQKVSKADGPESPEAVAKWCQEEAQDIVDGRK